MHVIHYLVGITFYPAVAAALVTWKSPSQHLDALDATIAVAFVAMSFLQYSVSTVGARKGQKRWGDFV